MARSLSRREFCKLVGAAGLSLGFSLLFRGDTSPRRDFTTGIELDNDDEHLSFEEAIQLCQKANLASSILKLETWRPPLSEEVYIGWLNEAMIQMQAEGLVFNQRFPIPPYFFDPFEYSDPAYRLGTSDCLTTAQLSKRLLNPVSPWHNSPDWLGGGVHELVHETLQHDLCSFFNTVRIEQAANIIMLEILAAMAARGNGLAFRSFVWEMVDICLGATHAIALQTDRMDEYNRFRANIHPGILSETRAQKVDRDFADQAEQRLQSLTKYQLLPLQTIMRAHLQNNDRVEGLLITPRYVYPTGSDYNKPPHQEPRTIKMDDWVAVMSRLIPLAHAFAALPENYFTNK